MGGPCLLPSARPCSDLECQEAALAPGPPPSGTVRQAALLLPVPRPTHPLSSGTGMGTFLFGRV